MSKGQRLLKARIDKCPGGSREIAAVIGITVSGVSRLASGERMPSLRLAHAMLTLLQIPMDAWDDGPTVRSVAMVAK